MYIRVYYRCINLANFKFFKSNFKFFKFCSEEREEKDKIKKRMSNLITQGSISRIHSNPKDTTYHPTVQVISIKKIKTGKSQAAAVVRLFFYTNESLKCVSF